jgi:hypothetical protein
MLYLDEIEDFYADTINLQFDFFYVQIQFHGYMTIYKIEKQKNQFGRYEFQSRKKVTREVIPPSQEQPEGDV